MVWDIGLKTTLTSEGDITESSFFLTPFCVFGSTEGYITKFKFYIGWFIGCGDTYEDELNI